MEMPMYRDSNGHYNRQVVTKLLNNYRSHASILKEPNEMFYDSELRVWSSLQPFFSHWFVTDKHTLIMNSEFLIYNSHYCMILLKRLYTITKEKMLLTRLQFLTFEDTSNDIFIHIFISWCQFRGMTLGIKLILHGWCSSHMYTQESRCFIYILP